MTAPARVLICDDKPDRVIRWKEAVEGQVGSLGWHVESITSTALAILVKALGAREIASRKNEKAELTEAQAAVLDELDAADLVILDSDLSPDPLDVESLGVDDAEDVEGTLRNQYGDSIARQVRTYTTAGFIVVVNMFWTKHPSPKVFDLTLTQGVGTFADLHIREGELDDPDLWSASAGTQPRFNPWSRPLLTLAPDMVRRSEAAIPDFKTKVLDYLGLSTIEINPSQLDAFAEADPTFEDLAKSALGFKYDDKVHDSDAVRRMAASVVRRWLARVVVASQDTVCDAPYLLARYPRLLGPDAGNPDAWNATAVKDNRDTIPLPLAAGAEIIELRPFTDRTVYSVARARQLVSLTERSDVDTANLVFAENASTFVPSRQAAQFEAEVTGSYFRRHLVDLGEDEVANEPFRRLLL